jgi:branched-chain amino acid transport system ATP-binding protein
MSKPVVLEAEGLAAGYGQLQIVSDLSLTVGRGEVVALLGPNGAGKTTTLLTLAGVLPPLGGTVTLDGETISGRSTHRIAQSGVRLVPQDRGVFHGLTVRENLRLSERATGGSADFTVADALEHFPALAPLMRRQAGLLSGGEQQMLGLARALVATPRVLLIDEMSLGLAPIIVERLLPLVRRIATERDVAVVVVEQHVSMALEIADRAYVLSRGAIVLSGEARELAARPDILEESYLGERALSGVASGPDESGDRA